MIITAFKPELIAPVRRLMQLAEPYVLVRTDSDYWVYTRLFSSSCPIAVIDNEVIGAVIAFRSQDDPDDLYVQDVATHPQHRRRGIARALLGAVSDQAAAWGCARLYLTSEPKNITAHAAWAALGFTSVPGDHIINGVPVITDFKGAGKTRAVFQLKVR